jgi:hypothetical protein
LGQRSIAELLYRFKVLAAFGAPVLVGRHAASLSDRSAD